MEKSPDWSGLFPELVVEIGVRLKSAEDYMALRGVCSSWRAAAGKDLFDGNKSLSLPLLMLAEKEGTGEREIYSLSKKKTWRSVFLPEAKGKRCLEAGFGWLATVDASGNMCLLNPISRALIKLPNITSLPKYSKYSDGIRSTAVDFVRAAFASSANPSSADFVLLVVAENLVAFWKPGKDKWTPAAVTLTARLARQYEECVLYHEMVLMCYCKDKFYCISECGTVWHLDQKKNGEWELWKILDTIPFYGLNYPSWATNCPKSCYNSIWYDLENYAVIEEFIVCKGVYLVASSDGELLLITYTGYYTDLRLEDTYAQRRFEVIRIDVERGESKVISGLDKDAVFISSSAHF